MHLFPNRTLGKSVHSGSSQGVYRVDGRAECAARNALEKMAASLADGFRDVEPLSGYCPNGNTRTSVPTETFAGRSAAIRPIK